MVTRAGDLAGDYELVQVQTQPAPGSTGLGRLHLERSDSAARAGAVGGTVRELIGWLQPIRRDASWADATSRDPASPGAALAGQHLVLGYTGSLESHVEYLTITAVAPNGFWGWWKAQQGLEVTTEARRAVPDPAGYFCALRVPP